jgi:heme-degrading monooxygenase HmoA
MIAVEVLPTEGRHGGYLEIAASSRDDLAHINGFISVERFQSFPDPKKLLSLSFWRDKEALKDVGNIPVTAKASKGVGPEYRGLPFARGRRAARLRLMIITWLMFALMVFALEPLVVHRLFHTYALRDKELAFTLAMRLHVWR